MRSLLRVVALLAVVAGGAATAPLVPAPASAAERCDGVWVVVDARELGGALTTRCAEGDPPSGLAALEAAGHRYTFVPRVPGMVCTIDQRPDPCNGAPSDAYWSYWHAEEGGSWTYASRGAGERDPKPGTVEGWAFGAGSHPGTSPPSSPPPSSGQDTSGSGSNGAGDGTGGSGGGSGSTGDTTGGSSGSSSTDTPSSTSSTGGSSGGDASAGTSGDDATGSTSSPEGPGAGDDGAPPDDGPRDASDADEDDAADDATDEDDERVPRRGTGADADDILAGRAMTGDDEADAVRPDELDEADEVAIGAPSDSGGGWLGVAAGTALVGSLAGAAVWRSRRRADAAPDL
jgi:hypothetical protein